MSTAPLSGSEREQFAAALHDLLGGVDGPAAARRWADGDLAPGLALWRRLAGLGVTALAVPEKWGGLGASPLDLVVACEELGHHALPGPVAESMAAVPALLAVLEDTGAGGERGRHGGRGASGEWLAGLADGDLIATLAMPSRLPFAADAEAAGLVLLAEDGAVYRGHPGIRHRSADPARSLSEVHGVDLLARDAGAATAAAFDLGALACSAQLLGAIGYTAEHHLSLWLAKVRALVPAWGSQAEHRARVVAGLT